MNAIKEKKIKYALITGAAKRIGASISRNIHQAGYNVGIHYHSSKTDAKKLCDELNTERAGSAQIFKADIQPICYLLFCTFNVLPYGIEPCALAHFLLTI